jgi:hypothetical protein
MAKRPITRHCISFAKINQGNCYTRLKKNFRDTWGLFSLLSGNVKKCKQLHKKYKKYKASAKFGKNKAEYSDLADHKWLLDKFLDPDYDLPVASKFKIGDGGISEKKIKALENFKERAIKNAAKIKGKNLSDIEKIKRFTTRYCNAIKNNNNNLIKSMKNKLMGLKVKMEDIKCSEKIKKARLSGDELAKISMLGKYCKNISKDDEASQKIAAKTVKWLESKGIGYGPSDCATFAKRKEKKMVEEDK